MIVNNLRYSHKLKARKYNQLIIIILFNLLIYKYNKKIIFNKIKEEYVPKDLTFRTPEKDRLYNLLNLKKKPVYLNDPLIIKEKKELYTQISKYIKKKNFSINYIYLTGKLRFGNNLVSLNNAIFFSEILGCKKLIIQDYNNLYIKNIIFNTKYNMTIEPSYLNKNLLKKSIVLKEKS